MHRTRWLCVALILVGNACSASPHTDDAGRANEQAVTAVGQYLEELARGDVIGAMAQRCRAARVTADRQDAFGASLDALTTELGGVHPVSIAVASVPAEVHALADLPDPIVVRFNLQVAGRLTEQLFITTVVEDGGRRVCGSATRDGYRIGGDAHAALTVSRSTVRSPQELMPADPVGLTRMADHLIDAAGDGSPTGLSAAWLRSWSDGDELEADVVAYEFRAGADALEYAGLLIDSDSRTVVSRFEVPEVADAIGLRLLGQPALWLQPADFGPQFDEILVVYGNTVVISDVFQPDPRASTEHVTALAASVDRLVGIDVVTS
ncbi:MAG: hypothetical protein ABJD24_02995 [Acidimicrobiales bacterium]